MLNRFLALALLPALGVAAMAQEKDRIRIRVENKVVEKDCLIKQMSCEEVQYSVEVEDKTLNQKEPADNVEEIILSKARKPLEFLQAEDEMDAGNFSAAAGTWAKAMDDIKDEPVYKQVALYKRALCFYNMGKFDEAIKAYQTLRSSIPDTYFLKKVFIDIYDCHRFKNDADGANKAIAEFEADGSKRGKGTWSRHAQLLKADLLETQNKHDEASKIYAKYTAEKGEIGEEAQIGELRCLSAAKNYEPLRSKAESIIRDGRKRSFRSLCAAYNGLGEVLRSKDKNIKGAMMAYLRGITEFQKYIFGTREHEMSMAMSAVTMSEYGKSLPEEAQKDLYVSRAAGLLRELQTRYPNSNLIGPVRQILEKK